MANGGTQLATLAYLDTNLVAAIRTRDLEPIEQDALRQLLHAHNQGRLEIVTSSVARDEINKHGDEAEREALEDIFMLLRTLTFVDEETLLWQTLRQPGRSGHYGALPVREADLARLEAILSRDDARHVYQAAKNSVDYFVTDDRRTILSHKSEIEAIVAIRVRDGE